MSFPPLNWIEDASASAFQDNVRLSLESRKRACCRGLIFSLFVGAACGLFIWKYVTCSSKPDVYTVSGISPRSRTQNTRLCSGSPTVKKTLVLEQ